MTTIWPRYATAWLNETRFPKPPSPASVTWLAVADTADPVAEGSVLDTSTFVVIASRGRVELAFKEAEGVKDAEREE
jgi:hypothetical protein